MVLTPVLFYVAAESAWTHVVISFFPFSSLFSFIFFARRTLARQGGDGFMETWRQQDGMWGRPRARRCSRTPSTGAAPALTPHPPTSGRWRCRRPGAHEDGRQRRCGFISHCVLLQLASLETTLARLDRQSIQARISWAEGMATRTVHVGMAPERWGRRAWAPRWGWTG